MSRMEDVPATRVSTRVTIILGLYDPPRNPRTRERATNQQIVDPPPFPHCLKIPFPQGSAGSSPASGTKCTRTLALEIRAAPRYVLTGKREGREMGMVSTTKMSSKGQVVIPEDVRKALGLEVGAKFVVMADGDVVILKRVETPSRQEFLTLAAKARREARRVGMKPSDVREAVRRVRRGRG